MHVLFSEDGEMEKRVFLATWKDIPAQNEVQSTVTNVDHSGGKLCCIVVQDTMYIIFFSVFDSSEVMIMNEFNFACHEVCNLVNEMREL